MGLGGLDAALNDAYERGIGVHDTSALALRADLEIASGAADEALAAVSEGLRACADTGMQAGLANLLTLRGDLVSAGDPSAAEGSYREAIAVAREQGGRTFELLAALPLARLLQTTNRPLEAHDFLAPALEGFTLTPELPAIAQAQSLLAELLEWDEVKTAIAPR